MSLVVSLPIDPGDAGNLSNFFLADSDRTAVENIAAEEAVARLLEAEPLISPGVYDFYVFSGAELYPHKPADAFTLRALLQYAEARGYAPPPIWAPLAFALFINPEAPSLHTTNGAPLFFPLTWYDNAGGEVVPFVESGLRRSAYTLGVSYKQWHDPGQRWVFQKMA